MKHTLILTLAFALLAPLSASGDIVIYQGTDPSATTGAQMVNSKAAQASFAAAVGNLDVEDFEGIALGDYPQLNLGDLSITATSNLSIRAGYNQGIAVSGTQAAGAYGAASVVFSFSKPIDAFGSYFSDVGDYGGVLRARFNDGTEQILGMPNTLPGDYGGMFFGFTDFGKQIVSVRIENTSATEWYSFDDVQWRPIPAPGAAVLGMIGLSTVGWLKRRLA